jgi:hypothetical protein
MYWSYEMSEPISEEKFEEFLDNDTVSSFFPSNFQLSARGDSIYTQIKNKIDVRRSKMGLTRQRDFAYDALLDSNTPSLPLRSGRSSDIITTIEP